MYPTHAAKVLVQNTHTYNLAPHLQLPLGTLHCPTDHISTPVFGSTASKSPGSHNTGPSISHHNDHFLLSSSTIPRSVKCKSIPTFLYLVPFLRAACTSLSVSEIFLKAPFQVSPPPWSLSSTKRKEDFSVWYNLYLAHVCTTQWPVWNLGGTWVHWGCSLSNLSSLLWFTLL